MIPDSVSLVVLIAIEAVFIAKHVKDLLKPTSNGYREEE